MLVHYVSTGVSCYTDLICLLLWCCIQQLRAIEGLYINIFQIIVVLHSLMVYNQRLG